jgi:hypothetical protein
MEINKRGAIMEGWIKLHRSLHESNMYRALNSKQRDVMIQCLILANHSEKEWLWGSKIYICKPGQFITSLGNLQKRCGPGVRIQSVRTALLVLEKWNFLTNKSTKVGRLITICNWDKYQGGVFVSSLLVEAKPQKSTKKSTKELTKKSTKELTKRLTKTSDELNPATTGNWGDGAKKLTKKLTKQATKGSTENLTDKLTDSQQRANKELTTNKNVKNEKKETKRITNQVIFKREETQKKEIKNLVFLKFKTTIDDKQIATWTKYQTLDTILFQIKNAKLPENVKNIKAFLTYAFKENKDLSGINYENLNKMPEPKVDKKPDKKFDSLVKNVATTLNSDVIADDISDEDSLLDFFNQKFKITAEDNKLTYHALVRMVQQSSFEHVKSVIFAMPVEGEDSPLWRLTGALEENVV